MTWLTTYPYGTWITGTTPRAWDYGVRWFSRRTVEPTELPVEPQYVLEALRDPNDGQEDELIRSYIMAATQACEDETRRAVMPQTWEMVLDGFPSSGEIHLVRPPFIEITSLAYYDSDNASAELAVSPAEFSVSPSGMHSLAILKPSAGESFPSTYGREDAVTVTFRAGFESPDTDGLFQLLKAGIVLMVGEMAKVRTLSVHGVANSASQLQLSRFWRPVSYR